jgi:hypothetical protein
MNRDLMLAVLAMDAYKTDPRITSVGNATLINVATQTAGFAAYAYTYNSETIISFRGTDGGWAAANDIFNGWNCDDSAFNC